MTQDPTDSRDPESATVFRLLVLASTSDPPLLARVTERLESSETWFRESLAWLCTDDTGDISLLLDGQGSLDRLIELKGRAKGPLYHNPTDSEPDREPVDRALLCYGLTVAAGLAHFGTNLSSRPDGELVAMFAELAAAVMPPWNELFVDAASAAAPLDDQSSG